MNVCNAAYEDRWRDFIEKDDLLQRSVISSSSSRNDMDWVMSLEKLTSLCFCHDRPRLSRSRAIQLFRQKHDHVSELQQSSHGPLTGVTGKGTNQARRQYSVMQINQSTV